MLAATAKALPRMLVALGCSSMGERLLRAGGMCRAPQPTGVSLGLLSSTPSWRAAAENVRFGGRPARCAERSAATPARRRRRAKSSFALIAVAATLVVPRRAAAEAAAFPLELAWNAPEGCPGASFVSGRVEHILRGSRVEPTGVAARGTIEKTTDGRFRLSLVLRTGDVAETRELAARTCPALAQAAAVVIALFLDPHQDDPGVDAEPPEQPAPSDEPDGTTSPAPPDPPRPPRPPLTRAPRPSSTKASSSTAPSVPPVRVAAGVGGALGSGVLPDVGGGIVLSTTIRAGRFRAGVTGTYWLRQSPTFRSQAGASFEMLEAGAFGAYLFPVGPVAIGPSVSAEVHHVRVEGFGIREPWARSTWWPAAGIGARFEAHLTTWLSVFARADAVVPIAAPTFTLATTSDAVRVHEPGPVASRATVGAEIVFP